MRQILAGIAWVGLAVSVVVHLATYKGGEVVASFPYAAGLHAGIFFIAILTAFLYFRQRSAQNKNNRVGQATMPAWAQGLMGVVFVYAIVIFLLFSAQSESGSLAVRDGQYLLLNHGVLIRHLTFEEYVAKQVYILRAFSAYWVLFYLALALQLTYFLAEKLPPNQSVK